MLKNYLKITIRNLSLNKVYAIINILGLAISIAVCLIIFMVIQFETSFDNFHHQRDHIYRVVSVFKTPNGIDYEPGVPFPTAPALRLDYPQLRNVASIVSLGGEGQLTVLDDKKDSPALKRFREDKGVLYAEPQFFEMFDFRLLAGDRTGSLKEPNTVLLTRSTSEKYFGSWQNAMGKYIKLDNAYVLKITGILDNLPANTDFPLNVVISYATLKNTGVNARLNDWGATFAQHYCFVVLPENLSASQFNMDLATVVKKYKPAENHNEGMMLLPLKEMHFDTRYSTFNQPAFSREFVLALAIIGLFVLVIACVNFINLATAQSVKRSKEVGIRKVLGSTSRQLLWQFIFEVAILIAFATLIAVGICQLVLPYFNQALGMAMDHAFITNPAVIEALILVVLLTTILAGIYPALILSRFNPLTSLKNKLSIKSSAAPSIRRVLVVLQFTISQALIICVFIIIGQMDYFKSSSLGFNKDAMVITHIQGDSAGMSKVEGIRDRLQKMSGIDKVSFSFASPIDDNNWNSDIAFNNVKKNDYEAILKWADANYPSIYGLKLIAGQFYRQSDSVKDLVVNEAFLKKLGIRNPQDAIGAKIDITGENKSGRITGIV